MTSKKRWGINLEGRTMWYEPWPSDDFNNYRKPTSDEIEDIYCISGEAVKETTLYFEECGGKTTDLIELLNNHIIDKRFIVTREVLLDESLWYTNEYYFYFIMFTKRVIGRYDFHFGEDSDEQLSLYHKIYEKGFIDNKPWGKDDNGEEIQEYAITLNHLPLAYIEDTLNLNSDDFISFINSVLPEGFIVSREFYNNETIWVTAELIQYGYILLQIISNSIFTLKWGLFQDTFNKLRLTRITLAIPKKTAFIGIKNATLKISNFYDFNFIKFIDGKLDLEVRIKNKYRNYFTKYTTSCLSNSSMTSVGAYAASIKYIFKIDYFPDYDISLDYNNDYGYKIQYKWKAKRNIQFKMIIFIALSFLTSLFLIYMTLTYNKASTLFLYSIIFFILATFLIRYKLKNNELNDRFNEIQNATTEQLEELERASFDLLKERNSLEIKVEERTNELAKANEQLKELDTAKTNFFANISHELRTPLTLILSPVQSALQGDYKNKIDHTFLQNLHRNAIKLLTLVNNLLDFSKLEAGRMTLNVSFMDISSFIKKFKENLQLAAESKKITLSFNDLLSEPVALYFDAEIMDKVIMNLASNALKFTNEGGSIDITISDNDQSIIITFKDTGVGIPPNKIDTIFDRFSQADTSSSRSYEGSGIGLALVQEFVTLHGGDVSVNSKYIDDYNDDHGSTFTITIPKGKDHLENKELITFIEDSHFEKNVNDIMNFDLLINQKGQQFEVYTESGEKSGYRVLIVEDNTDMRDFLSFLLRDHYMIETAINGEDGLDKARKYRPDAIITDVMMPVKDGFEMTLAIKSDPSLRHIPVLMLTAKAELSHKLEALELGADDYLIKPFNSKELLTRIKSLLKSSEYEKQLTLRNEEIESELEIARLIQDKLLPSEIPAVSGYKAYGTFIPFNKVGGDFYDYKVKDNLIYLFIADSSGHGLASSYLSLIARISLDSIENYTSADKVLYFINDYICRSTVNNNFVTSFSGVIDIKSNVLKYCSASHEPLILYRRKTDDIIPLNTKGNRLGWFPDIKLEEKEIQLESGDRLVLYTDGIIETQGNSDELYGPDRFYDFIREKKELSPKQFSDELMNTLREYSGIESFEDDVTLLVCDVS